MMRTVHFVFLSPSSPPSGCVVGSHLVLIFYDDDWLGGISNMWFICGVDTDGLRGVDIHEREAIGCDTGDMILSGGGWIT